MSTNTAPTSAPNAPQVDDELGRAMRAVLDRETDPRAAAWLAALLSGDDAR